MNAKETWKAVDIEIQKDCGGVPTDSDMLNEICPAIIQQAIDEATKPLKEAVLAADDFQCDIASALGWKVDGKPFDECVRDLIVVAKTERIIEEYGKELKAEVKQLRQRLALYQMPESKSLFIQGKDLKGTKAVLKRLRAENDVFHDWYAYHLDIKNFEALTQTLQALDAEKAGKEEA